MKIWENSKRLGNTRLSARVPTAFLVLPNFHLCFYNSTETRNMFSFSQIQCNLLFQVLLYQLYCAYKCHKGDMSGRNVSSEFFQFFEDFLIYFSAKTRLHIVFPHFLLIDMHIMHLLNKPDAPQWLACLGQFWLEEHLGLTMTSYWMWPLFNEDTYISS